METRGRRLARRLAGEQSAVVGVLIAEEVGFTRVRDTGLPVLSLGLAKGRGIAKESDVADLIGLERTASSRLNAQTISCSVSLPAVTAVVAGGFIARKLLDSGIFVAPFAQAAEARV